LKILLLAAIGKEFKQISRKGKGHAAGGRRDTQKKNNCSRSTYDIGISKENLVSFLSP
jgi:hypothetical protein